MCKYKCLSFFREFCGKFVCICIFVFVLIKLDILDGDFFFFERVDDWLSIYVVYFSRFFLFIKVIVFFFDFILEFELWDIVVRVLIMFESRRDGSWGMWYVNCM